MDEQVTPSCPAVAWKPGDQIVEQRQWDSQGSPPRQLQWKKRGQRLDTSEPRQDLLVECFMKAYKNSYTRENPQGIINLGVACNSLVHDIVKERLSKPDDFVLTSELLSYGFPSELCKATADYLNREINPHIPLTANNIVVTAGVTGGLDCLTQLICDPGDGILITTPFYGNLLPDCTRMPEAKFIHINTYSNSQHGPFRPSIEEYKSKFKESKDKGLHVRAVLVTNPHNPAGFILTRQELEELVQFCYQNSLHLVVDEVYMKCILDPSEVFTSVLELELPNPDLVHVLWGYSKDFGVPGLRVGCIVCAGTIVPHAAQQISLYYDTSSLVWHLLTAMIKDQDWIKNVYFPKQTELLQSALKIVTEALDSVGVEYILPKAGLFIMADLRKYVSTEQEEMAMLRRFFNAGVYMSPGSAFYSAEHGWFRIVFSVPLDELRIGLERFCAVIQKSK